MVPRRYLWFSIVITLAIGLVAFRVTVATTNGFLVWSDGLAYFFHARSLVLDGNSDITNEFDEFDRRYPVDPNKSSVMDSIRMNTARDMQTGRVVSPWPVGMGLVAAPFYALGFGVESIVAFLQGREPDSYGLIPQYFFAFASLVFGLGGFWATYLCARQFAAEKASYLAAFSAVFAGPAVFYIFVNPSMAHAISFGLAAALVLLWLRGWFAGVGLRTMLLPGLLLGLLVTIRLQNAIFGLLLAALVIRELWRSGWLRSLGAAMSGLVATAIPVTALVLHSAAYGPAHAKFALQQGGVLMVGNYPVHLKSPFFFDVLFSCRHGAFHWAPILALGTIGLVWAARRESWALVLLAVLALQVYLIGGIGIADPSGRPATFDPSNWNDHWKGGTSFGMRYLTECTPIFAAGLVMLFNISRTDAAMMLWRVGLAGLVLWNGLLILAYGLGTVSRSYCVSYGDMYVGVTQALAKVFGRLF
jgi:hypothetical protein